MSRRIGSGEAIVEILQEENVTHLFGIVGSSFLDILDSLYDRQTIEFVGTRHEQGAALMADGYARVTGKPGVCIATNGPGVLNLTYGVGSAFISHSPVVVLAPSASRDHQNRDSTQEFDQVSLFRPITKAAYAVNKVERLPDALRQAFRIATSGKMGPVLVDIPRDVIAGTSLDLEDLSLNQYRSTQTRMRGDIQLIHQAVSEIKTAKKPVIVAGGGINWSLGANEVTELAELTGSAIVTSYGRADAVPNSHPNFLGHLGRLGAPEAIDAIQNSDLIIAAGTRLSQSTTFYDNRFIPADVKIIQIELDPKEIGRNYPITVGIEGDVKSVLKEIIDLMKKDGPLNRTWANEVQQAHMLRIERLNSEGNISTYPMKPQRIYAELRKVMPHDAIIALDAGLAPNFGQDRLDFNTPRSLISPLDLGGLGFSFPTAIGAAFGAPDKHVVNFNGDGGFLFNAQEFETAVRYNQKLITVVMNNDCWGSEKAYQKYAFNERYVGADTINPRYDKYAELFGGTGFYVDKIENIASTFRKALDVNGPSIIEIPTDPDEMPRPARLAEVQSQT
ncbi:MAG TPA: sulfoacetaldehyde acetyltransferase [Dehalococcoidia bacterium]|jgi:thiamine pyrophosphate-dependent acetolactate synthase large subunit-like protein|nr:sulfoacetaldehyde acetyltransferase [Dehalococcoidia bacterium]